MTGVLGYTQYAADGSDYGAMISGQLGHKYVAAFITDIRDTFRGLR